jgi:hypothetical protein
MIGDPASKIGGPPMHCGGDNRELRNQEFEIRNHILAMG